MENGRPEKKDRDYACAGVNRGDAVVWKPNRFFLIFLSLHSAPTIQWGPRAKPPLGPPTSDAVETTAWRTVM